MRTNKLRTALTGLAVSWGIFMLIILVGLAQGVIHAFNDTPIASSSNMVQIYPGMTSMPYNGLKEGRYVPLKRGNLEVIERENPGNVVGAMAEVSGASTISTVKDYVSSGYRGVYPGSQKRDNIKMTEGRFINDMDLQEKRKVIVLDARTVDMLFDKRSDAIGSFVKVNDLSFKVVGYYDLCAVHDGMGLGRI